MLPADCLMSGFVGTHFKVSGFELRKLLQLSFVEPASFLAGSFRITVFAGFPSSLSLMSSPDSLIAGF